MSGIAFTLEQNATATPQKPREKLGEHGPEALTLWELLALVLRVGTRSKQHSEDVMELARRLLGEAGFKGIFTQSDVQSVRQNFGVYKTHAEMIVAVSEICRRLQGNYDSFNVREPSKVFEKFKFLAQAKQEQCHVLHINGERQCIYQEIVAIGSDQEVQVSPTDVLRTALWLGRKTIMIVHNHPGKSVASKDDIAWTLALARGAAALHDVQILDHVIIGHDGYFSFLEKGLL